MNKPHTAVIFAHKGTVTAIAFKGEPMNFNGTQVLGLEADSHNELAAQIHEHAPVGVGSPWPPVKPEAAETPEAPKKAAKVAKAAE